MKLQWASWTWLLDSCSENGTQCWESGPRKQTPCVIFFLPPFFSSFFRICRGRVVVTPGIQNAVSPTTASQTRETSPVLWWSSGSELESCVSLDWKDGLNVLGLRRLILVNISQGHVVKAQEKYCSFKKSYLLGKIPANCSSSSSCHIWGHWCICTVKILDMFIPDAMCTNWQKAWRSPGRSGSHWLSHLPLHGYSSISASGRGSAGQAK